MDGDDENRDDEETGEEGMDVKVGYVLQSNLKFNYEYDFGTTTELTLTVVSEYEDKVKGKSILLLAQNEPPLIVCSSCKRSPRVCAPNASMMVRDGFVMGVPKSTNVVKKCYYRW